MDNYKYKKVKNVKRPGRPPSGSAWAKDDKGNYIRNAAGEFAYGPATKSTKAKSAKPGRKKKAAVGRKPGRAKKVDVVVDDKLHAILLSKKTYKQLSSADLLKISTYCNTLMDAAKAADMKKIDREISKLESQKAKLG